MTKDDIIRMAREAGAKTPRSIWPPTLAMSIDFTTEQLERFAALVAAAERNRADALAATAAALRDVVTTDAETKEEFVGRVRAVLGEDPDARVLGAVLAERERCAKVAEAEPRVWDMYAPAPQTRIAAAIRALK